MSFLGTQSRFSFNIALFLVKSAKSLLLNTLSIVSNNLRSSAVSNELIEGVGSVVDTSIVGGVVLAEELSGNVTFFGALVGADLDNEAFVIGFNCSDCSHLLLCYFCKAFAANLITEFDLFNGRAISANCASECDKGNCDAIDVLKIEIIVIENFCELRSN